MLKKKKTDGVKKRDTGVLGKRLGAMETYRVRGKRVPPVVKSQMRHAWARVWLDSSLKFKSDIFVFKALPGLFEAKKINVARIRHGGKEFNIQMLKPVIGHPDELFTYAFPYLRNANKLLLVRRSVAGLGDEKLINFILYEASMGKPPEIVVKEKEAVRASISVDLKNKKETDRYLFWSKGGLTPRGPEKKLANAGITYFLDYLLSMELSRLGIKK